MNWNAIAAKTWPAALLALTLTGTARAQAPLPLPAPPAYAVAQRLEAQAQAASAYAVTLAASGHSSEAASQNIVSRNRAVQAIREYGKVTSSATFRKGPYAAESLFQQALLQRDFLKDEFGVGDLGNAVQTLKTLHNNFAPVDYPDKPLLLPTLTATEQALDKEAQTPRPTFWGTVGPVLYRVMDFFVKLCGGPRFAYAYPLAILLISVLLRLLLTPLSNKQYATMKEQQKLQPLIKEVQAKYKDNREEQGRRVMEVYKEHGINPAAGCIPALAQAPVFLLLYQMIVRYQYQFTHGKFLWVGSDLAHQFPAYLGINLAQQDIPLLLLYALSMYVQQRIMISPDPQQAEQQRTMAILTPFMSTYFFLQYHLPSAFVLYYLVSNILATVQQQYYMKKRGLNVVGGGGAAPELPPPPVRPKNGTANGNGAKPVTGNGAKMNGNGAKLNGATPAARGVIAPAKVHPKKKRRS